jgi:methylene-tetrahydromethanopterin dehydrogenase
MGEHSIIHMIDPMTFTSPFAINMTADADFDFVIPYTNVKQG